MKEHNFLSFVKKETLHILRDVRTMMISTEQVEPVGTEAVATGRDPTVGDIKMCVCGK